MWGGSLKPALAGISLLCVSWSNIVHSEPLRLGVQTTGYTFFNRVDATKAQHDDELKACLEEVRWVRSIDEQLNGNSGVVGGLVVGLMSGGVQPSARENCMIVKGWRVVTIPDAEGLLLKNADAATVSKYLEPLVGKEFTKDQIARSWNNDASDSANKRFELRPPKAGGYSLSLKSIGSFELSKAEAPKGVKIRELKPIPIAELPAPSSEQSLVMFHINGATGSTGYNMLFMRMADTKGEYANDGQPNFFGVGQSSGNYDRDKGAWRVFSVPPGQWRIYAFNSGIKVIDFCLGSPAFNVKGGEVLYAGAFGLNARTLRSNVDISSAKDLLIGKPELAEQLTSAKYTNGWTSTCLASLIYALELPDASFRSDYTWGSATAQPR